MQKSEIKVWRLLDVLNHSADYLARHEIDNAKLNAERLLAHVLNLRRIDLYLNFDRPLSGSELTRFKKMLKRRASHEPLQYIVGETEFMGLPIQVTPSVLIPRPETEILVERVLEACRRRFEDRPEVSMLDLGTGSGCIAVALAKLCPAARVVATDVSEAALDMAEANAEHNDAADRIRFLQQDLFEWPQLQQHFTHFDVIVSNPPYVAEKEFADLPREIREHEPHVALVDGADGFTFFRAIAELAQALLRHGGVLAVEVGLGQERAVAEIFRQSGFAKPQVFRDLNDIGRVVLCET